jgi:hypothetical protein
VIWLAGQLWPLLLLSAFLGAACVAIWGQRRVTVEEWAEVPVVPAGEPAPVPAAEETESAENTENTENTEVTEDPTPPSVTAPVAVDADDPTSPFPVAAGERAPWEEEELWSRPARVGAGGQARRPKDEWTEAAENWRSWADEATGRGFSGTGLGTEALDPADRDLFAADREPTSAPGAGPDDGDPFPYARPVEAPSPAEGTMDPMEAVEPTDDALDDDEREAAEIRRMREQERRGDEE